MQPFPLSNLRILIVEDEPLISVMIEQFIADMGCDSSKSVETIRAAVDALGTFGPDVVLLDVSLGQNKPDFTIADMLADRAIPFVFSSGYDDSILPERHKRRPFVAKPYSINDLVEALATARAP